MHDDSRQPDLNAYDPDWDAFARFVAGESDPVEAAAVEAWLAAHPEDAMLAGTVKSHEDASVATSAVSVNVDAALAQVRAKMAGSAPSLTVLRGGGAKVLARTSRGVTRRYFMAAAAVVVGVVGVQSWRRSSAPVGATDGAERIVATAVGQRDSVTLADGSKVMLAPGSRLTVAAGFTRGERIVLLEGAAFFDVRHDDAHPFTVRAAGAEIRDVGTAFSVKTDVGGVSVSVTHGIVAMRESATGTTARAVELRAGDRGVLRAGNVAVTRGTVTPDDIAWTRGQLTYRDASLAEVQADLKRWYGINLQVADSALSRLTVTMPAQSDSARIISTIAALLGADAEQHGDTVILHSAGRGTTP